MNTLGDVKAKVRALVGDPIGDFATDAYLTPLINQVYEDQTTELMASTGSSFDDASRDLLNVPPGTRTLAPSQAAGCALAGLVTPLVLRVKPAGAPEGNYVEAWGPVENLPDTSPATYASSGGISSLRSLQWSWTGGMITLTPLSFAADLRLKGEFSLSALVKDSDVLTVHPRMAAAVAYGAAALIGVERENETYAEKYAAEAERSLDMIAAMLVRAEQGEVVRIGLRR